MSRRVKYGFGVIILFMLVGLAACKKWLPKELGYLSPTAVYTQTTFNPILGRTTVYSLIFNTNSSSTPIHFEITNVRYRATGKPATDLGKEVPVQVWKQAYTGDEKSLAEIEAKRTMENHPIWEVRPESGDLILWASADSSMMKQQPDSGYLFDVVASNSGGTNTYKDMVLDPFREQPYSPYNDRDVLTGQPLKLYPNPADSSAFNYVYNHPIVNNILGDSTDQQIISDSVRVLFHKTGNGSGNANTITFKFLDKDSVLIDPASFNRTIWDSVLHGFNVRLTKQYVRYDVAYPIPLTKFPTRWTTGDGSQAHVKFSYDRVGFGGITQISSIEFSFAIYQKGDWEVLFYFHSDTPRFRDE